MEPKDNGCCGMQGETWFLEKGVGTPDPGRTGLPRDLSAGKEHRRASSKPG